MAIRTLMMTAAACALIAGGATAQDTDATAADPAATTDMTVTDTATLTPEFTSIEEMTVGDIVGQKVYDPNGDSIGKIDYIVGQGGGADAVIGIGGFLGIGKYTVALPLEEFTYDAEQQMVQLDTTKEVLKEHPEFDTSDIEGLPDETPLADLVASSEPAASDTTADDSAISADDATGDDMTGDDTSMSDDPATEGDTSMEDGAATDEGATTDDGATMDDETTTDETVD